MKVHDLVYAWDGALWGYISSSCTPIVGCNSQLRRNRLLRFPRKAPRSTPFQAGLIPRETPFRLRICRRDNGTLCRQRDKLRSVLQQYCSTVLEPKYSQVPALRNRPPSIRIMKAPPATVLNITTSGPRNASVTGQCLYRIVRKSPDHDLSL